MSIYFFIPLDFVSLIYNYITQRLNIPTFNKSIGPPFVPTAGVPQGSCLGPTLFAIFVNDAPNPLYKNTFINLFADDTVHVVTSENSGPHKIQNARHKLKNELKLTLEWERKWKIKTNTNKIKVGFFGTTRQQMDIHNNLVIDNVTIPFDPTIRILGFTLNHRAGHSSHVIQRVCIATNNLKKLYRFKSASPKTKLQLYKSLISPLLEYPSVHMSSSPATYISKLQKVQNKALRFIYNYEITDYVPSQFMHLQANLDPLNVRLSKLSRKALYKMREHFFPSEDEPPDPPYLKFASITDYHNGNNPLQSPQISQAKLVNERIFQSHLDFNINLLNLPQDWDDWVLPEPKYI